MACKMFHQLSLAIKYCHNLDVMHQNLKFSKLCLRNDNSQQRLSKTFCGSAAYAAPEVLQGIPYQPKVYDIWSLGVILYITVCGSMPYDDSDIRKMLCT
ncbi:hypothetical protein H8959_007270 [Pygathrix nigripes]